MLAQGHGSVGVFRCTGPLVTDADDVFLGMVGYTPAEVQAGLVTFWRLTPPDEQARGMAGAQAASTTGGFTVPFQKTLLHKSGHLVPVLVVSTMLSEPPDTRITYAIQLGSPSASPPPLHGSTPSASDSALPPSLAGLVTELVRERQRMVAMLDNTDELISAVDPEVRLLSANRAFQQTQRAISGRDMHVGESLVSQSYPESLLKPWREWYARALQGERFSTTMSRTLDGKIVHTEHRFAPIIDPMGGIVGATVVAQDVSVRFQAEQGLRESEARFRTVTSASPLGIFLTDATGACVYANPRLSAIWGLAETELHGLGYLKHIHPTDRDRAVATFYAALEQGSSIETEYSIRRGDGTDRHVRVWASPVRDSDIISGFAGSMEDDTEQRELASRLGQREKMESLGTLAGGVAHDFNNMLGVVLGHTELALSEGENLASVHESLREIRTAGVRARDLVQQILAFSRRAERSQSAIDIRQLAAESIRLLRSTFPASVTLDVRIAPQPMTVHGDASALQQIIVNLCTNAEHAMRPTGGGVLTVTLDADGTAPTGRVLLTVRDSGIGMSPEVYARAFEPFFTTKAVGEGTGMGLAVVHGVVTSHGGTIAVDSTLGVGTTVRVELPLTPPPAAIAPLAEVLRTQASGRVLLAEDEPALARFIERALAREGYVVTSCHDGLFALEQFQKSPHAFDALLTDLTMPGMSGDRLALAVKHIRHDLPVILMTGFSSSLNARNSHEHGIDILLDKPFSGRDLVRVLAKAIPRPPNAQLTQ